MEIGAKKTSPITDATDEDDGAGKGPVLRCARCGHEITREDAAIEIDGRHEHYFVNPHGFDYRVRCFRTAPGVVSAGPASSEFTWFAGMTWQLDCCRGCADHIGWIFRSPKREFHGLIADKLISDDD